ncbi:hypothetical protein AB0B31_14620 [Catellatospora citrea]|uniref:hypothetical protein n=1 Tax=Catellatospora citrea TaxID=53366 RepID=UPI0033D803BA
MAALIELAVAIDEPTKIETYAAELRIMQLTESKRERVDAELRTAADLDIWLTADPMAGGPVSVWQPVRRWQSVLSS